MDVIQPLYLDNLAYCKHHLLYLEYIALGLNNNISIRLLLFMDSLFSCIVVKIKKRFLAHRLNLYGRPATRTGKIFDISKQPKT